ncbi:MAG: hypothetical protein C0517_06660 [Erythrobacter sp.]|nr:hypothetical protein [Erythrobacter sp.]
MFSGNQDQFAADAINARLESLLQGECVGNGTPLASVVATALDVDRRRSPVNDHNSISYSNGELLKLATDILITLDCPHSKTTLLFGTILETRNLGEILIDGECWTLDAGRPGLHPAFTARKGAHGPNLELLHHHISRLTRKLACRRLGLPQPLLINDNGERHLLHFAPCAEAGGVVLQCWANGIDAIRFCGAFPEQIEEFAESIVKDMRSFWKHRKGIAKQGAEVRAIAETRIAHLEAAVDAIIIDMGFQFYMENLDFHVHYLAIDVALRPGLVLDYIPASRREAMRRGANFGPILDISGRYEQLDKLRRHGADGRITELAAAVMASGRFDSKLICSKVSEAYDVAVEIPGCGTSMFAAFYWADGSIYAEVCKHGTMNWNRDVLEINGFDVPEAKLVTMIGKPLSDLVELPFGGDIIVEQVERIPEGLRLHVAENYLMIDLASGRTWECPDDLV